MPDAEGVDDCDEDGLDVEGCDFIGELLGLDDTPDCFELFFFEFRSDDVVCDLVWFELQYPSGRLLSSNTKEFFIAQ